MKTIIFKLLSFNSVIILAILFFFSIQKVSSDVSGGQSSNSVTCYCTYEHTGNGGSVWEIYRCGTCQKQSCASYSDQMQCTYTNSVE